MKKNNMKKERQGKKLHSYQERRGESKASRQAEREKQGSLVGSRGLE